MSTLVCPNCAKPREAELEACFACGVFFAKWKPREQRPAPAVAASAPAAVPVVPALLAAAVLAGVFMVRGGKPLTEPGADAGLKAPVEAAAGEAESGAAPSEAEEAKKRLDPLMSRLNGELASMGIQADLNELKWLYDRENQPAHEAVMSHRGPEAGLGKPESRGFDASDKEKARGADTKCLVKGEAAYGGNFTPPEQGASECWKRMTGNMVVGSSGNSNMVAFGAKLDLWERWHWQPHNRRWAPYDENGERTILRYLADSIYGTEAERKDGERAGERLKTARSTSNASPLSLKQAVLEGYESAARRAGVERRLEIMNGWQ